MKTHATLHKGNKWKVFVTDDSFETFKSTVFSEKEPSEKQIMERFENSRELFVPVKSE